MSVEARDLMSLEWTRWQGQVINGVFPLGRFLGHSDHSGVFLTRPRSEGGREVAIKLLPATRAQEELQIPRWARAGALAHPHLLPLLEWGSCQLDGLPYLYVVMEYADQTLAQLLLQRALTAEEAREMLRPILKAFEFLHRQDLLQGQLQPANVLVVGDQLKLSSDTIRHRSEARLSAGDPSAYEPPEGRDGHNSAAGDIWALGVSLFEALARRSPVSAAHRNIALPADFPPEFRDVVGRCLSHRPEDRPDVDSLLGWMQGRALKAAPETVQAPARERPNPTPKPASPAPATVSSALDADAAHRAPSAAKTPRRRAFAIAALAAGLIALLVWTGERLFTARSSSAVVPAGAASEATPPLAAAPPVPTAGPSEATAPFALHQVTPNVPQSAARTLRGHVKVAVRALVDPDGSVSAVIADRGGPSKYFQRLALGAAKQWVFPQAPARRLVEIQFDFSRDGTTVHAAPVR